MGLKVEKEKVLPVVYEDVRLDCGYRIDLLIKGKVIIELKAVNELSNVHLSRILTCLKLAGCRLGLLITFNSVFLKDGVEPVVDRL